MTKNKSLLVYYSYTGNIESLIPMFRTELNIDIVKLETVIPYPNNEKDFWIRYNDEIDNSLTPPIKEIEVDFNNYNTIILITPNWSNKFPPAIRTFLAKGLLKNKTIVPIITSDRNGEANITNDIKAYTQGNIVTKSLVFLERGLTQNQLRVFMKEVI